MKYFSADSERLAFGLKIKTSLKLFFRVCRNISASLDSNTLITKWPLVERNNLEKLKACSHKWKLLALSTQAFPVILAQRSESKRLTKGFFLISNEKTASNSSKASDAVKSRHNEMTFDNGTIGNRSMATILTRSEEFCDKTCDQLPGAAPKSIALAPGCWITFLKGVNLSKICSSLKADLARKPSFLEFFTYSSFICLEIQL